MEDDPLAGLPQMILPEELAKFLRVTDAALAKWRSKGTGPAYIKVAGDDGGGAVRYPRHLLREYLAGRVKNTSAGVS